MLRTDLTGTNDFQILQNGVFSEELKILNARRVAVGMRVNGQNAAGLLDGLYGSFGVVYPFFLSGICFTGDYLASIRVDPVHILKQCAGTMIQHLLCQLVNQPL